MPEVAIAARDIPTLDPGLHPPVVHGMSALASAAYAGQNLNALLALVGPVPDDGPRRAAALFDQSLAHRLCFRAPRADTLQAGALALSRLFRVADGPRRRSPKPLRVLALVIPGDLMANTPLEFITAHLDVRLDLLFVVPGASLPPCVPEHDVAFCAVGEPDAATTRYLTTLFVHWPRPMLNDPAAIGRLSREAVARGVGAYPGILAPEVVSVTRARLEAHLNGSAPLQLFDKAAIIRPFGSHAGHGLELADGDLAHYLERSGASDFHVTRFVDYRDRDGLFRKYRVALIDDRPHLCHMASSEHWMVHYLNAGMTENADRRADEERAMAGFDDGFARRHAGALAFIADWLALDYSQLDCAEAPDGRLLVFEVDVAAIIHLMDPPDLFPYKPTRMRRVFDAFGAMLARKAREASRSGAGVSDIMHIM